MTIFLVLERFTWKCFQPTTESSCFTDAYYSSYYYYLPVFHQGTDKKTQTEMCTMKHSIKDWHMVWKIEIFAMNDGHFLCSLINFFLLSVIISYSPTVFLFIFLFFQIFSLFSHLPLYPSHWGVLVPTLHCMVQNISHTIPLWNTHMLCLAYCLVHYILPSLCHGAFPLLIHSEWKRRSCGKNQQNPQPQQQSGIRKGIVK